MTILLVACRQSVEFSSWPALAPGEISFIVILQGDTVMVTHGPYSGDGVYADLPRPEVVTELVHDGERILHLAFDPMRLRALVPAFPTSRLRDLRLEAAPPGCSLERRGRERRVTLESLGAVVSEWTSDGFQPGPPFPVSLSVVAVADEESCFDSPATPLRRFGPTVERIPPDTFGGGLNGILRDRLLWGEPISPDYVLAAGTRDIFAFARDQPWTDSPEGRFGLDAFGPRESVWEWRLLGVAVDPVRRDPSQTRLVVAALLGDPRRIGPVRVAIAELEWTPAGFGPFRILFESETERHPYGFFVQRNRRYVIFGNDGLLLTGSLEGGPAEFVTGVGLEGAGLRAAADGLTDDEPLVLLESRGSLLFGDPGAGLPFRIVPGPQNTFAARGLFRATDGRGESLLLIEEGMGVTLVRADESRAPFRLEIPQGFEACATEPDPCGAREIEAGENLFLETADGRLIMASERCSAPLEVDIDTGCARVLPVEEQPVTLVPRRIQSSMSEVGGVLTIVGDAGRILQAGPPS